MADVAIKDKTVAVLALDDKVLFSDTSDGGATKNAIGVPVLTTAQTTAGGVNVPALTSGNVLLDASGAVIGAVVSDAASLTLTAEMANTKRAAAGALTYTIDVSTGWSVGDSCIVNLPSTGSVSFALSGGATLNGASTTLTRDLASNASGYVVITRTAGTNTYSLTGTAGANLSFNGTTYTIATGTITTAVGPLRLTETRNNAAVTFPGIVYNVTEVAQNSQSLLLDLQVNGATQFKFLVGGRLDTVFIVLTGFLFSPTVRLNSNSAELSIGASHDTRMKRLQAGVWDIDSDAAGGLGAWRTKPVTVAQLPSAVSGLAGTRAAVTDANSTTFFATAVGGGSNNVPVYCTGAAWVIA